MILSELSFFQFRNLKDCSVSFSPKVNILVGQNGQGKTNLVEGIHILSTSKSFRTGISKELIGWEKKEASVIGTIKNSFGDQKLGVILNQSKKILLVDGNNEKASQFISRFVTITFSPSDIDIVKGEATVRRQFIDKHLADIFPQSIPFLLNYAKALKTKSLLLKQGASSKEIEPWNEILIKNGFEIVKLRRELIILLSDEAASYHHSYASGDGALSVSLKEATHYPKNTLEEYQAMFEQMLSKEIASTRTIVGPHKDDVFLSYNGIEAKKFASQGQSKSIAIALRLGLIEIIKRHRGESPVVILDDVDSELDEKRLEKLYDVILKGAHQVFITGTEVKNMSIITTKEINKFSVKNGEISPE